MIADRPVQSPFKFLDAYTAADTKRFFGRETEQKRLLELLFTSRLILVYGASGTGKSSLVQCGLAKAMSDTDYFPLIIRRRGHFSNALQTALNDLLPSAEDMPVDERVRRLTRYSLRPVYLIFDQFEELFISGNRAEQEQFFSELKRLHESGAGCKLLLVMREEYLAHLYPYENDLPTLLDFRLRVEPMSDRALEEVILGTLGDLPDVTLENGSETARLIIDNNRQGRATFQLPYLQVYLDRLWREAARRQQRLGLSRLTIDPALVTSVGAIDDVLETFLREQRKAVATTLDVERSAVTRVLEAFVTYEGTRREHRLATLQTETGLEPGLVSRIVAELERSRLLREEEGIVELPHDSLARIINAGRSAEQRLINDIIRRLREAYREYIEKQRPDDLLLSVRRLSEVESYQKVLRPELERSTADSPAIWQFVEQSQRYRKSQQQQELDAQKARNRRLRRTVAGVAALCLVAVTALLFASYQWTQTNYQNLIFQARDLAPLDGLRVLGWVWERRNDRQSEKGIYAILQQNGGSVYQTLGDRERANFAIFSPDGTQILLASGDHLRLLDNGGETRLHVEIDDTGEIEYLQFAPDGRHFLALTPIAVRVWNTDGRMILTVDRPVADGVESDNPAFTTGSDSLLTFHGDTVTRHSLKTPARFTTEIRRIRVDTSQPPVTPGNDSTLLADGNILYRWRPDGLLTDSLVVDDAFRSVYAHPDQRRLLTNHAAKARLWYLENNTVWRWPNGASAGEFTTDGKQLFTVDDSDPGGLSLSVRDVNNRVLDSFRLAGSVSELFLSKDKSRYVVIDQVADPDSFRLRTFSRKGQLAGSFSFLEDNTPVTFSADGRQFIQFPDLGLVHLVNERGQLLDSLDLGDEPIIEAAFSPDNRRVLIGGRNRIMSWNRQTRRVDTLRQSGMVNLLLFSPDGRWLLTGSGNRTIIRDAEGRQTGFIPDAVTQAAFSSDNRTLLGFIPGNSRATLWNLHGDRLAVYDYKDEAIQSASFDANGHYVLILTTEGLYRYPTAAGALHWLRSQGIEVRISDKMKKEHGLATSLWDAIW